MKSGNLPIHHRILLTTAVLALACLSFPARAYQFNTSNGTNYGSTDSAFKAYWDSTTDTIKLYAASSGTAGNAITWIEGLTMDTAGASLFQVGNDAGACTAAKLGRIRYNGTSTWEYCNNATTWTAFGAGSAALSGITAATTDATIASGANNINWNWQLTGAETGLVFGETAASTGGTIGASGNQFVLKAGTLATSTATPLVVTNLGTANSFRVNDETGDADATPFVIDASGNVGIGTASPTDRLHVVDTFSTDDVAITINSSVGHPSLFLIGDTDIKTPNVAFFDRDTLIQHGNLTLERATPVTTGASQNDMVLHTQTAQKVHLATQNIARLTVDDSGKVGIGTASPGTKLDMSSDSEMTLRMNVAAANDGHNPLIWMRRSKGTIAAPTAVDAGAVLMELISYGHDGTDYRSGAHIAAVVDGTPGANDMPTRLEFNVQADGAAGWLGDGASVPELVIKNSGNVGIGTDSPQSTLHVPDGKYAQFEDNNAGAPPAGDCDADAERGRMSLDTTNNRLYICNGATRGWDYVALTD